MRIDCPRRTHPDREGARPRPQGLACREGRRHSLRRRRGRESGGRSRRPSRRTRVDRARRVFLFQEGQHDPTAARAFAEICAADGRRAPAISTVPRPGNSPLSSAPPRPTPAAVWAALTRASPLAAAAPRPCSARSSGEARRPTLRRSAAACYKLKRRSRLPAASAGAHLHAMVQILAAVMALISAYGFLRWFASANPASLLSGGRKSIFWAGILLAVGLCLTGRIGLGIPLVIVLIYLNGRGVFSATSSRNRRAPVPASVGRWSARRRWRWNSTPDGEDDGRVLAGTFEGARPRYAGRSVALERLAFEISADPESRSLLEVYPRPPDARMA